MTIRAFLGYRTLPATILITAIYVVVLVAIFVTDSLPDVPHQGSKKLQGLDLKQARRDLEHIAARPHPYNSHANDAVRAYLLNRLDDIAWAYDHVQIDNDLRSNGSWASTKYGVYFEGTNLLVKIRGTDDDPHAETAAHEGPGAADGVLFSAHYDSVSTAPGATDDGMGVTTLLQLIQYFAEHRQRKTAIFNINNGEEDWLNGAHAFLQHPWANLTSTFLNLEGAAAGGRPILFRASSLRPLQAYSDVPYKQRVRHPHANVLSSDAFARGVIRSGTDYSVYTGIDRHGPAAQGPMLKEGLDVAFYKGRSRYHTKWDAPAFTEGGEQSLWSMIDVAKGVGIGLLNPKGDSKSTKGKAGVYFDLFKTFLVSFSLKSLLVFNIVSLVVGPIVLGLLFTMRIVLDGGRTPPRLPPKPAAPHSAHTPSASAGHAGGSSRQPNRTNGDSSQANGHSEGLMAQWRNSSVKRILTSLWKQASFWIALLVAIGLQVLVIWGYVALNPFTVYSRPYLVLLSLFSLAFFSIDLVLKLAFPPSPEKHTIAVREAEKTTLLLHMHFFTWIVLLVSTILVGQAHIGGLYAVTMWYLGVWAAALLGTLEPIVTTYQADKGKTRASGEESERTPLLRGTTRETEDHCEAKGPDEGALVWWIVQVVLTIPAFILLLGQIGTLLLDSTSQTIGDGASPWGVYIVIGLLGTLLSLPVAPFSPKLHRGLTLLALATFAVTTAYLWLVFPFSREDPLKVYFQQTVAVDPEDVFLSNLPNQTVSLTPVTYDPKIVTELTGATPFMDDILAYLPSARDNDVTCGPSDVRLGLTVCRWESKKLAPHPGGHPLCLTGESTPESRSASFFRADVTRSGWESATIVVQGRNTKNCRLYFDPSDKSGVKVTRYSVLGGTEGMQSGYPVNREQGLRELRLWSRTWDRTWEVDVDWETITGRDTRSTLKGRIACEWAEYESGMVDNGSVDGDGGTPKIPALEEALAFLPEWTAVTKNGDGLVEASVPFAV